MQNIDIDNTMSTVEPPTTGYNWISNLSEAVGASEAALRLLISILAGYPIVLIYRGVIVHQTPKLLHHTFFAFSGVLLCVFNYGIDTYHSVLAIWITYLLVRLLHSAPHVLVVTNFVFHMSYLLFGYYYTESNSYDILWTMPHCVLVLRMIGFGFDIADGRRPRELLSKDQQHAAIEKIPTLLELSAFAYFPLSFLVGPQFPYCRYQRFINGEFIQYKGNIQAGLKRMFVGVLYLAVRQVGATILPDDYLLTDAYRNEPFVWRLILLGLWGKLVLYKYISCWLLAEGALMLIGFSYAEINKSGEYNWFGCSNVKLLLLETGHTMQHYVQSFNVNTNQWVAQYVYKRLKFLNNRTISYGAALCFLAIWHGFHSGYYMAFLMEYMIVTIEKQIENLFDSLKSEYGQIYASIFYKCLERVVLKSYNIIYMGWCLTPFAFLSYAKWTRVYSAVNFFGFIYLGIWIGIIQLYKFTKQSALQKHRKAPSATTDTKRD